MASIGVLGRPVRRDIALKAVGWASDAKAATLEDVGIDHGRPDIVMPEEFLNRTDVVPVFEQVGRKGVPQ
jgi:hypothetical protein